MNRIVSVLAMHARDRATWFVIPLSVLGAGFAIVLLIALSVDMLFGGATPIYTGALTTFYFVMILVGIGAVTRTFPFAIGFGARRRDYLLGTLAMGAVVSAAWGILLGLLSLIEANLVHYWGVGLHFFHLPVFSDGSPFRQFCWSYYQDTACMRSDPNYYNNHAPLQQFWVYFALLLFLFLLGLLLGSIYQRFGRIGEYAFFGVVFLLLSVFILVSAIWNWWDAIFGWFDGQSAATLGVWLLPPMALFALASYALLRKATV
ncbi:MAG TPA: hypothetical protein VKQ36_06360 [Ktedonobacterales bacterium]|nr:hypothetical protein [Ktedonobacterales bacterium]